MIVVCMKCTRVIDLSEMGFEVRRVKGWQGLVQGWQWLSSLIHTYIQYTMSTESFSLGQSYLFWW